MAALLTRGLPQQNPLTKGLGRIRCNRSYAFVLRDLCLVLQGAGSSSQPSCTVCIDCLEVLKGVIICILYRRRGRLSEKAKQVEVQVQVEVL
ncbi:hypothetical protein CDAR_296841 [Caerostris darwini]|uniref:Uncharacterized protein n=1 Tax=Caerostris darwini TaxID=1538125 RepID=A0AAV4N6Y5_9ARAC|nr:hypothetical protein CDAR_296841 [Caerostris darwini]